MSINRDKGKLKYPGYIVTNEYLHILVENMLELAAEIDDFDGMFFMIYGKDMKLGTRGRNPVETFLSKYSPFDRSLIQSDDLIMDLAIEVRSDRDIYEARTMLTLSSSLERLSRQFGFVNFDHYRSCFTEVITNPIDMHRYFLDFAGSNWVRLHASKERTSIMSFKH
jgi:hypothetical protein